MTITVVAAFRLRSINVNNNNKTTKRSLDLGADMSTPQRGFRGLTFWRIFCWWMCHHLTNEQWNILYFDRRKVRGNRDVVMQLFPCVLDSVKSHLSFAFCSSQMCLNGFSLIVWGLKLPMQESMPNVLKVVDYSRFTLFATSLKVCKWKKRRRQANVVGGYICQTTFSSINLGIWLQFKVQIKSATLSNDIQNINFPMAKLLKQWSN